MGIEPAVAIANRLIHRLGLEPPIDVESLIRRYATLIFAEIPIAGVDGISIDLKVKGKQSRVVVNNSLPATRQKFTLAHELGHLLIPWHVGTIVDQADPDDLAFGDDEYSLIEKEANAFAAAILIPTEWLEIQLGKQDDLAAIHADICKKCGVSPAAAATRMSRALPENIIYCAVKDDLVRFSGRTAGTVANAPIWNEDLPADCYLHCESHYNFVYKQNIFHWWRLPSTASSSPATSRPWREDLDDISDDLGYVDSDAKKFKSSVNGVVAAANSVARRSNGYNANTLMAACLHRFSGRREYVELAKHRLFIDFLSKRCSELAQNAPPQGGLLT